MNAWLLVAAVFAVLWLWWRFWNWVVDLIEWAWIRRKR